MRLGVLARREAAGGEQAHPYDHRLAADPRLIEHDMAAMHDATPVVETGVAMQDREIRIVAADGDCPADESDFLLDVERRPVLVGPLRPACVLHHVIPQPACRPGADAPDTSAVRVAGNGFAQRRAKIRAFRDRDPYLLELIEYAVDDARKSRFTLVRKEGSFRGHSRYSPCFSSSALISFLTILPYPDLGMVSQNTKRRGHLYLAIRVSRWLSNSSGAARIPDFGTTTASPDSPHFGSGTPSTATSDTAGCFSSASSISRG